MIREAQRRVPPKKAKSPAQRMRTIFFFETIEEMFHQYILENRLKNQPNSARMSLYMSTDEQKAILLTKGVESVLPSVEFLEKQLSSGEKPLYLLWL